MGKTERQAMEERQAMLTLQQVDFPKQNEEHSTLLTLPPIH